MRRARRGARAGAVLLAALFFACGAEPPPLVQRPASPPPALRIRNVSVLDVEAGIATGPVDVLLRGDRIAAIGVAAGASGGGATVVDGRGGTLLPGLVDAHAHVNSAHGPPWQMALPDPEGNLDAYLYCGVTALFDPGDASADAVPRRDRVLAGELLGPRIYTAGPVITARGGHPVALVRIAAPFWLRWYLAPRVARQMEGPVSAAQAAEEIADAGVDFVKLVVDRIPLDGPRMTPAEIRAAVLAARARGVRSVAHVGSVEDALDTGHAGVDAWMHIVYKERIPDAALAEMASFGIPVVPTLAVWDGFSRVRELPREFTRLERETVEPALLEAFQHVPEGSALLRAFAPFLELLARNREAIAANVRRLHDAGVPILAGSDAQPGIFPGAGLHREIALLHAAGLSPAEAIRAATLLPARFLANDPDPDFGRVAVGKRADLLLVDGDPLQDLGALARIREVILGGVRLERAPVAAAAP